MAMIAAGFAILAYFPQLLVEHVLLDSLNNSSESSQNVELDIVPLEKELKIPSHDKNTQLLEECIYMYKSECINLHKHLSLQKTLPKNDNH